jgi:aspartyl/asparaginyl-tRNA synthetase
MDLEMGYIDSMYDVMDTEIGLLKYILEYLNTHFCYELQLLEVKLPLIDKVPVLKFREAKELIVKEYGRRLGGHGDLDPEEEVLLCDYATKHLGSEFNFITHFPSSRRPFYVMDDPEDPGYAFSFDLLFRGLEITTGGQRIHSYTQQVQKMKDMGLDPAEFAAYLSIHKHGMPPHGGLGLGLERLEMQLLGLNNVRHTSLFPRDVKRITP